MKKMYRLFLGFVAIAAMTTFISCEGPAGADGVDGVDGADGTPGVAGNLSCLECHTQAGMDAITNLYEMSGHFSASTTDYAGGRSSCSRCHSGSGFLNYLQATPGADLVDIDYPTRIECETCHGNHSSLEDGIAPPIRTIAAVTGISDGTVFDFGNNSNLCVNCHQSRRDYTYYEALDSVKIDGVMTAVGAGNVGINSSHAGPHHGPQTNMLFGNGGYGTSATATHTAQGCTTCHMGEAGATSGGHSFNPNIDNCKTCHADATDFDINGKQSSFDTRMEAIAQALVAVGALAGDATEGYHPAVSIVTEAQFKAFWNYMMCYEDHSHGVHNPGYTNTLLTSAEANLGL